MSRQTHDFPRIGINTETLIAEISRLLGAAEAGRADLGAVNWGDLGIADIEYRLSVMVADAKPQCVVLIEEASPDCGLAAWIYERLDKDRFPNVRIECEW